MVTGQPDKTADGAGVVYVASGDFHAAAAAASARSVRSSNPWLPIDIFTDSSVPDGVFDQVIRIGQGHERSKVDCLARSRFARSLYLDSDTRVVADLHPMFDLLSRFDLALAHGHKRYGARQKIYWRQPVPEAFPQVNGGVILFRQTGEVKRFLDAWSSAYQTAGFKWDQITLRELLWLSELRIYILPPEYNVRYQKYLDVWTSDEAVPKILHFASFYEDLAAAGAPERSDSKMWTNIKWGATNAISLFRRNFVKWRH